MKVSHLPARGLHKVSSSEASFPAHSYIVSGHKESCSSFSKSGSPCNSCILTHTYKFWKPGEYPVCKLVLILEYANTSSSYQVVLFTHVSQLRHMDKGSRALAPLSLENTNTFRSLIQIGSESSNPNIHFSTGKNEWKARVWYNQPKDWWGVRSPSLPTTGGLPCKTALPKQMLSKRPREAKKILVALTLTSCVILILLDYGISKMNQRNLNINFPLYSI